MHKGKKPFLLALFKMLLYLKSIRNAHKNSLAINHKKSVVIPEEYTCVNFQNFKRLVKSLFIIYIDFECILKLSIDNSNDGPSTTKAKSTFFFQLKLPCNTCW